VEVDPSGRLEQQWRQQHPHDHVWRQNLGHLDLGEQCGTEQHPDQQKQQRVRDLGPLCEIQDDDAHNYAYKARQNHFLEFYLGNYHFIATEFAETVDFAAGEVTSQFDFFKLFFVKFEFLD